MHKAEFEFRGLRFLHQSRQVLALSLVLVLLTLCVPSAVHEGLCAAQ